MVKTLALILVAAFSGVLAASLMGGSDSSKTVSPEVTILQGKVNKLQKSVDAYIKQMKAQDKKLKSLKLKKPDVITKTNPITKPSVKNTTAVDSVSNIIPSFSKDPVAYNQFVEKLEKDIAEVKKKRQAAERTVRIDKWRKDFNVTLVKNLKLDDNQGAELQTIFNNYYESVAQHTSDSSDNSKDYWANRSKLRTERNEKVKTLLSDEALYKTYEKQLEQASRSWRRARR